MDTAKAIILSYTPEPARMCASAAKLSTTEGSATEIYRNTDDSAVDPLIEKVVALGHVTILEQAVFNIAFEGVSVLFEQFLIEHRLASYTVKSRRYVDYSDMGGLIPTFRTKDGLPANVKYQGMHHALTKKLFVAYNKLLELGIPKEDARFVLPYNLRSHIYCTVNARELLHIIKACIEGRGANYPEFYQLGLSLLAQAVEVLPSVFSSARNNVEPYCDTTTYISGLVAKNELFGAPEEDAIRPVELFSYNDNTDLIIAIAALVNSTGCSSEKAFMTLKEDKALRDSIIEVVTTSSRPRELEQMNITFKLNDISMSSLTHLTRHRMQSLIVPTLTKKVGNVYPDTIRNNEEAATIYRACFVRTMDTYLKFKKEGIVEEDLAYFILSGDTTNVITTMNGRELYHFLKLRCCNRAQWEIRDFAVHMLAACRQISESVFNRVGPACFMFGSCPEGKMSCGKQTEVKGMFTDNGE